MPAKRFSNYQNPLSLIAIVLLVVRLRRTRVLLEQGVRHAHTLLQKDSGAAQPHDGRSYCSYRAKLLREAAGSRMRGMIKAVSS